MPVTIMEIIKFKNDDTFLCPDLNFFHAQYFYKFLKSLPVFSIENQC